MEKKFITLGSQSTERAKLLKNALENRHIECILEKPDTSYEETNILKVRVKIKDFEEALGVAEKIDEQYGAEEIKIPEEQLYIRKIIVPVIFKDYSIQACDVALHLAQKYQAHVRLFHSYYNPFTNVASFTDDMDSYGYFDKYVYKIEEDVRDKLEKLVENLKQKAKEKNLTGVHIDYTLTSGSIYTQLQYLSKEYNPDLVVIGTKGEKKKHQDIVGRVTSKIIEKLNVPVLAAPKNASIQQFDQLSFLYITNFDSTDYPALRTLMTLAKPFNPYIYCLHVEDNPNRPYIQKKMDSLRIFFQKYYNNYNVSCEIIEETDLLDGIENFIQRKNIDMISLNVHKKNILTQLFTRSVPKRVLFHTNKPLLVYHF